MRAFIDINYNLWYNNMLEDDYIGQTLFAKKRPKEDFILYFKEIA